VRDCIYTTKTFIFLTACLVKLAPDKHLTDPVCTGHPACIGDPASIRTFHFYPRLVLETRLLYETRLLLEVLRYRRQIYFGRGAFVAECLVELGHF